MILDRPAPEKSFAVLFFPSFFPSIASRIMALKIFEIDPTLRGCEGQIWDRVNGYRRPGADVKMHQDHQGIDSIDAEIGPISRWWSSNESRIVHDVKLFMDIHGAHEGIIRSCLNDCLLMGG